MRLIDADALLEALKDNGTYEFKSGAYGGMLTLKIWSNEDDNK